jgi:hypothetical protein
MAREEDVSSGIQDVSDGNHAVHIQWQLKITSIAFCEFQFHGEYLQGCSIAELDHLGHAVCILH